jgi:NAD(P)-dependent dehydrogenase (short-subunit alcohol dehydrogenase family)
MSSNEPMTGKVCLVTGASAGIGQATAQGLAATGAHVVLICRSAERGRRALEAIRATGAEHLDLMVADLASQRAIRRLAQEVRDKHPQIHVLVNNAGAFFSRRVLTEDGLESTFAVNYLAPFLLTNLLLDPLRSAGRPELHARIVNVASVAHRSGRIRFNRLDGGRVYIGLRAYQQAKLALVLWTFELARRLEDANVTVNCLDPGTVSTEIGQANSDWLSAVIWKIVRRWFAVDVATGAATSIYLASSPDVEGTTGKYFLRCKETAPALRALDEVLAQQLWKVSEQLTEKWGEPPTGSIR